MAQEPNVRDAKLIQYLNEAYGNEKRLETALEAHIAMTERAPYKKRLREHLTETKRHAREVERRIKQLGGSAETTNVPGPSNFVEAAGAVVSGVQKAAAVAQGPLHALRGTGAEEKQLKNAKTEYAEEAQEIAMYSAVQTFAEKVGDRDTANLAKSILREEQRMATFLAKEIERFAKAVATAEVPAALRSSGGRRRTAGRTASRTTRSSSARGGSARASAARSSSARSSSSTRATSARASGSSSRKTAATRKPAASRRKTAASGKPSSRSSSAGRASGRRRSAS